MEKLIVWFKKISKNDIAIVGGKGANLGEMASLELPIPNGFCTTSFAFRDALRQAEIDQKVYSLLSNLDVENTQKLQEISAQIQTIITNMRLPDYIEKAIRDAYEKMKTPSLSMFATDGVYPWVAVRSSATAEDLPTASFAGQQATFLNVRTPDKVINAVKKCWASLFTARAIYYREKQGFSHTKVALAAVIQTMVDSKKAGVMFTAMPTGDTSKMVIEAAYGLGEAVVSGSLTPDTYIIKKENNEILDKRIEPQKWKITRGPHGGTMKIDVNITEIKEQKITDNEIKALANYGRQLEAHYGHPQDIEWGIDKKGKIFILQTRAITTLKPIKKEVKPKIEEEKETTLTSTNEKSLVEGLSASPGIAKGPVKLIHDIANLDKVNKGDILVTEMTTPDFVPAMRKARAIVTDAGGITAHAAIVSRELGIPCIVGTENATKILKDNMIVVVDADNGRVYPETHQIEIKSEKKEELIVEKQPFITTTKVKVNVALPEAVDRAAATNPDGIGLLRAEHMITSEAKHPAYYLKNNKLGELKNVLKKHLREFSKKLDGKPIWYRTFDARTDEFSKLEGAEDEPKESNPMLGWHGIRRSLDQPDLIRTEFKAIKELQDEGLKNIGVMIPFTQHVREYKKAKELAIQTGINMHEIEFGIMVETPGAALTIEDYIKEGLDFISFGTNDLTQLTLGLDRNNEMVQKLWTELHPAVLYQIKHVINACKKANVQTSICGQAGSNPEMVRKLIRMGITSVSANIDAVQKIRQVVADEERKIILNAAIKKLSDIR